MGVDDDALVPHRQGLRRTDVHTPLAQDALRRSEHGGGPPWAMAQPPRQKWQNEIPEQVLFLLYGNPFPVLDLQRPRIKVRKGRLGTKTMAQRRLDQGEVHRLVSHDNAFCPIQGNQILACKDQSEKAWGPVCRAFTLHPDDAIHDGKCGLVEGVDADNQIGEGATALLEHMALAFVQSGYKAELVLQGSCGVHQLVRLHFRQGDDQVDRVEHLGEGEPHATSEGDLLLSGILGEVHPGGACFLAGLGDAAGFRREMAALQSRGIPHKHLLCSLLLQQSDHAFQHHRVGGDRFFHRGVGEHVRLQQDTLSLAVGKSCVCRGGPHRLVDILLFVALAADDGNDTHESLLNKQKYRGPLPPEVSGRMICP